jgi:hypothetical protein
MTLRLVEQVCAVEPSRPLAVHEGLLQVLVRWLKLGTSELIRTATAAVHSLASIHDKYTACWIHTEMINMEYWKN